MAGSKHPTFEFRKGVYLVEATTLRAASVSQLLMAVTLADDLSLFYHLHRHFFLEPAREPDYPNDFAQWAASEVGSQALAERLANLNLFRAHTLHEVRREISLIVAGHLRHEAELAHVRVARPFVFCLPWVVVLTTDRVAATPAEFLSLLREVESDAIAFHLFAPKLRPAGSRNDFAVWFGSWGYRRLASQLDSFDPYLNSLEDTRNYLCELIASAVEKNSRAR